MPKRVPKKFSWKSPKIQSLPKRSYRFLLAFVQVVKCSWCGEKISNFKKLFLEKHPYPLFIGFLEWAFGMVLVTWGLWRKVSEFSANFLVPELAPEKACGSVVEVLNGCLCPWKCFVSKGLELVLHWRVRKHFVQKGSWSDSCLLWSTSGNQNGMDLKKLEDQIQNQPWEWELRCGSCSVCRGHPAASGWLTKAYIVTWLWRPGLGSVW